MKRSTLYYSLAAVLLYCLFLIISFPASQAWQWLAPTQGIVELQDIEGSMWQGRATQVRVAGVPVGEVNWRVMPLQMFLGKLAINWRYRGQDGTGNGVLYVGPGGDLSLSETHATSRMSALRALFPRMPVLLAGDLRLTLATLKLEHGLPVALSGTADWLNGRTVSPVASEIGTFHAVLTTRKQEIQARISDTSGPLDMQGIVRLQQKGSYYFVADLKPRTGASAALLDGLQQIARSTPGGGFRLEYRGQLESSALM